ncbi:glycosyltransferase family 2 protein [Anatilimnocola floriformis]|uniref:glycosyltransferase family 2 protein n=1 Tax=Anatilimnocola floriformis TaxID=2948575 RepID=UPI0020C3AF8D|nr:glycosyltransferase family 2 protein [Anatilimnocola floriformis]
MPRLSIVIPCLGAATDFDDTLVSVLQNRPDDCEVLVVHVQPYDDPYGLQNEVRFVRVNGRPTLVQLMNAGLSAASGDIVHMLGCRMIAVEGWADAAVERFADSRVAALTPLIVDAVHGQITAAGVRYSMTGSRKIVGRGIELKNIRRVENLKSTGPTIEAGFFRRDVLEALGGWQESLGVAADIDLAISLAALELKTIHPLDVMLHEKSAAPRLGGFAHGRSLERLFCRHAGRRRTLPVLLHSLSVALDFTLRIPKGDALTMLIGRAVGLFHSGTQLKYAEHIAEARTLLEAAEPSTLSLESVREEQEEVEASRPRRRAA